MIYTLTVECVSGAYLENQCIRVIEIDKNASLYDLRRAIHEAVKFDYDHIYDFYAGRNPRNRKIRYSEKEEWEERENDYFDIELNQVYPLGNLKLYYLFDYGDMWIFEIKKARKIKEPEPGVSYPRVTERIGPNPEQYPSWEE